MAKYYRRGLIKELFAKNAQERKHIGGKCFVLDDDTSIPVNLDKSRMKFGKVSAKRWERL